MCLEFGVLDIVLVFCAFYICGIQLHLMTFSLKVKIFCY